MTTAERRVTRADIEAKLREIQGEARTGMEAGRDVARLAGAAGVVVVLGIIYLLGRRHGRKKRTIVEIRRV